MGGDRKREASQAGGIHLAPPPFGEANDAAALGVVTLEELALAVDPSGERLGLPVA